MGLQGTAEEQMLSLNATTPAPSVQPDSPMPAATAIKPEPAAGTAAGSLVCQASPATTSGVTDLHPSPVVKQPASTAQHAAPQHESQRGQLSVQVDGKQLLQLEQAQAQAEALNSTVQGPQPGLLQQPSGQLGHVAADGEMPEQGGAVSASGEVLQVPGPLGEASKQQRGEGCAVSPRKGVATAAPGSLQGVGGQQTRGSPAGSPGGGRVVNAAQGRERTEAARRGTRNSLLLSLHRVAVSDLPQYQDVPIEDQSQLIQH